MPLGGAPCIDVPLVHVPVPAAIAGCIAVVALGAAASALDDIRRIASFAASLGTVERVEVLPFHQLGRFKWQKLHVDYQLERTQPPTVDAVNRAIGLFRAEGLTAC